MQSVGTAEIIAADDSFWNHTVSLFDSDKSNELSNL